MQGGATQVAHWTMCGMGEGGWGLETVAGVAFIVLARWGFCGMGWGGMDGG